MSLTKKEKVQYILSPDRCPFCRSELIYVIESNFESDTASRNCACQACGRSWVEVFKLVDIEEV